MTGYSFHQRTVAQPRHDSVARLVDSSVFLLRRNGVRRHEIDAPPYRSAEHRSRLFTHIATVDRFASMQRFTARSALRQSGLGQAKHRKTPSCPTGKCTPNAQAEWAHQASRFLQYA